MSNKLIKYNTERVSNPISTVKNILIRGYVFIFPWCIVFLHLCAKSNKEWMQKVWNYTSNNVFLMLVLGALILVWGILAEPFFRRKGIKRICNVIVRYIK